MTYEKPILGEYKVGHHITIAPAQKMDSPNLWAAICTCGYRSSPTTENDARTSGLAHRDAKNRNEEKP